MKKRHKNNQPRPASFSEILESTRRANADRLGDKARQANQVAKIARNKRDRDLAYEAKSAFVRQGVRCHEFKLVADEQGRSRLAVVRTGSHGMLHVPVHQLGDQLLNRHDIRTRFRGVAA
jgi:hypothetical protein